MRQHDHALKPRELTVSSSDGFGFSSDLYGDVAQLVEAIGLGPIQ